MHSTDIFDQIENHTYTIDKCFLCGCQLTESNETKEHVIPKWIQNKFNLWEQKLRLINGTLIKYRHLTIPCCFDCNNIHLKPFEDKIKRGFEGGYSSFKELDKESIFYWLGKIYFGIMYREMFLKVNQSLKYSQSITNPDYLKSFYSHFLFLQGIRKKHTCDGFIPASIHVFKTQKPKNVEEQWDFIDSHNTLFISIRMGDIGIISPLQDCGATQKIEELLEKHRDIELHPLQFREMTAKILYKRLLMNRTPKFLNIQNGDIAITNLMPLQGLSNKPIFDDWDNDIYSLILSEITEIPLSVCQPEKGKVWTWLSDEEGKSIFIPVNE